MESWQVEQINARLPRLIQLTDCNVCLLSILQTNNLLHSEEVERIQAKATRSESAKLLYEILLSRSNGYQVLTDALVETRQSGAAAILQKFPWDKVANLRVKFLEKVYAVNEFLDSEQVRKVHQWFQENLSPEESSKFNETVFKSESVLELVRNTIPKPDPLYIPRFLSRRLALKPALFHQDCQDIFVFKNIDRLTLRPIIGRWNSGIEKSSDQIPRKQISSRFILLTTDAHWEKIRAKISPAAPIHLIKFEHSTGEFVLETTSGGSGILNEYLEHRTRSGGESLSEEQFVEMSLSENGSAFCICDSPGMGKSLLLANIARTIQVQNPDIIVAFICLRDLDMAPECAVSSRQKILKHIATSSLAFRLLREITETSQIKFALFFDGLDEVQTDRLELITRFLQIVIAEMAEAKVYITARPVVRKELERLTKTIPYDIRPFDQATQLDFLASVWKQEHTSGSLESFKNYARFCLDELKESLTEKEREISGVPLLCKMIADAFVDKAFVYAGNVSTNIYLKNFGRYKNLLLEVYEKFVERQLGETQCNFECLSINCKSANCSSSCKIKSFHVWCAIQLIFPDFAKKICKQASKFANLNIQEHLAPGLLLKADEGKLDFSHRTFAEYLVAEYFAKAIFMEHPTSFWRKRKFEKWATDEILSTVDSNPDLKYAGVRNADATLREYVVGYFLNAFITNFLKESCQKLKILNTASVSVTSVDFLRPAVGCLRFDFDGVLEILFGKGTFPNLIKFEIPNETVVCLQIAGEYCRASTIKKLTKFYMEQFGINLFEKYATNQNYARTFQRVLRRAEYEVTQIFINSIQNLQGHGFLYACPVAAQRLKPRV